MDRLAANANSGSTKNSVFSFQNLELSSVPIRLIRLIRGSQSSHFLKRVRFTNRLPDLRDSPERFNEKGATKPVETEQSVRHGFQGGRIRERSRPVCCSSCLLLVLFATESSRCNSCTEFVVEPKFGGDFLQKEISFVFPANQVHTSRCHSAGRMLVDNMAIGSRELAAEAIDFLQQ